MNNHKQKKEVSALRDRNLAKTAPLAFCLYIFLQELHWQGSNTELVKMVGDNPEQLTLVDLRNILLKLGYNTTQSRLARLKRLNKYQLPAIFVDDKNNAFVIYKDSRSNDIFAKNYNGIFQLNAIGHEGQIIKINEELIKPSSSLKDIIIAKLTKIIANAYTKSLILATTGLLVPLYIRIIYNVIIPSGSIISSVWIFICGLLVLWCENRVRNSREELIGKFLAKIENNLESRLLTQITSQKLDSGVKHNPDELDKITINIQIFIDYLRTSFIYAMLDSPFIIIYLIAIAIIGGNIVWAPIIIMGVSALITLILSQYYDSASATESRKSIDTFREQYNLIKIDKQIRFLGLKRLYTKRLKNIYASQAIANLKASKYMNYLQIYLSLSSRLAIIISLLILFNANSNNSQISSQGTILSIMFLFYRVFGPYQLLLNAILKYKSNRKIYNFLNDKFFLNQNNNTYSKPIKIEQYNEKYFLGHLDLDEVTTKMHTKSLGNLRGVSLKINPGELIVISCNDKACSKSMVDIMCCIDSAYEGNLLIDGTNSRQFSQELLSSNIACAFEKQHFFDETILYNLKIFNETLTDEEIHNICKSTGIHDYILKLEEGYSTRMSQYLVSELNNGFIKMLTITQALIKDTPIIILEEPTNGLSPTEFDQLLRIMPSFRHRLDKTQKRTVVIFSSSEVLMEKSDRVYAMDKGRVVFNGTKEQLKKLVRKGQ
uniref:ATP-binding cassette domain-containing protein n=1 Tax=Synechococcus sp. UW106 TaxID=368495 RepID=UPI000E0F20CF|nr:ATP-binding cassette domain-containing protein [Synechococcus sp. UW106]